MALTDRGVRNAKAGVYGDSGGLYLRVYDTGKKVFVYRDRKEGKDKWITLGQYPVMELKAARETAESLKNGSLQQEVILQKALTEYKDHVRRTVEDPSQIERRLNKELSCLTLRKVRSITKQEVADVLQGIVKRGSPVAANRTLPDIKNFFAYCMERGWVKTNPAEGITRKSLGGREKSRERALDESELKELIRIILTDKWAPRQRLVIGLLILTGQRIGEVLGYRPAEIDRVWWFIPAERTKPRRMQKVYLSPQARSLFEYVDSQFENGFGGDHRTIDRAIKRTKMDFTPHDLRRTMATHLADKGIAPHVIEKMLNHKMEGVMEVYNRAEYLKERREAWRLWGCYIARLRREVLRPKQSSSYAS